MFLSSGKLLRRGRGVGLSNWRCKLGVRWVGGIGGLCIPPCFCAGGVGRSLRREAAFLRELLGLMVGLIAFTILVVGCKDKK